MTGKYAVDTTSFAANAVGTMLLRRVPKRRFAVETTAD